MKTYRISNAVLNDYELLNELGSDANEGTRWTEEEVVTDAENFEMTAEEFISRYLEEDTTRKYWLDCDSHTGSQFALYENESCILKFNFDDIDGLKELEAAGQIAEAYELINKYIETELGFLPEYEVG